jgi:hypothetical protein
MRRKSKSPDLFASGADEATPPPRLPSAASLDATIERKRVMLPGDLAGTLKHLDDRQLDTLLRAVTVEARRRGRLEPRDQTERTAKTGGKQASSSRANSAAQTGAAAIPQGQANLIKAAFKAGMKPTAISRELGISLLVVRSVLASS